MEEMIYEFYQVDKFNPAIFSFYSEGIRLIKKIVSFEHSFDYAGISIDNLVLADELENGTLDAEVNSNNGDILKVLNTVAAIVKFYISTTNNRAIYIKGSDERRINVYHRRIIKELQKPSIPFVILGQQFTNAPFEELEKNQNYIGFLVIRQR